MNVSELERLAGGARPDGMDCEEAITYLASRVIAAENLVGALQTVRDYVSDAHIGCLVYDDGKRVSEKMTTEDISLIDAAIRAYEATK